MFETDQDFLTKKVSSTTCKNPSCPRNLDPKETEHLEVHQRQLLLIEIPKPSNLSNEFSKSHCIKNMCLHVDSAARSPLFSVIGGSLEGFGLEASCAKRPHLVISVLDLLRGMLNRFEWILMEVSGSVTSSPLPKCRVRVGGKEKCSETC